MGTIRPLKDPHNLSDSRVDLFFGCAAQLGYEYLFEGAERTAAPFWLPGGGAVHHAIDEMLIRSVAGGKTLPMERVNREVALAKSHVLRVLGGERPPKHHKDYPSRLLKVMWMSEEEEQTMDLREYAEKVQENKIKYLGKVLSGIRAVALRCTVPSPFAITKSGIRFKHTMKLVSPRDPRIEIPIKGEIDVIEQHMETSRLIITDWKTGNFGHYLTEELEGNSQMLIYHHAVREMYHVDPIASYFVSLNVWKDDVLRHGPATLELERYRVQANIRYEEHFPELLDTMDDVWAVLMFLAHPPITAEERKTRDEWQPRSHRGKKFGIKRHVEEGRLIPNPNQRCGMCPAYAQCRRDNPEDWEKYLINEKLANVVNITQHIPESWIDPNEAPDPKLLEDKKPAEEPADKGQLTLFDSSSSRTRSPLKNHKLTAAEWERYGFFPPKKILALMRRMHELVPLGPHGEVCPCKRTDRIPLFYLRKVEEFFVEREDHKLTQETRGKTRGGEGKQKVLDLFDSENVRDLLKDCPIPGCPFSEVTPCSLTKKFLK